MKVGEQSETNYKAIIQTGENGSLVQGSSAGDGHSLVIFGRCNRQEM